MSRVYCWGFETRTTEKKSDTSHYFSGDPGACRKQSRREVRNLSGIAEARIRRTGKFNSGLDVPQPNGEVGVPCDWCRQDSDSAKPDLAVFAVEQIADCTPPGLVHFSLRLAFIGAQVTIL